MLRTSCACPERRPGDLSHGMHAGVMSTQMQEGKAGLSLAQAPPRTRKLPQGSEHGRSESREYKSPASLMAPNCIPFSIGGRWTASEPASPASCLTVLIFRQLAHEQHTAKYACRQSTQCAGGPEPYSLRAAPSAPREAVTRVHDQRAPRHMASSGQRAALHCVRADQRTRPALDARPSSHSEPRSLGQGRRSSRRLCRGGPPHPCQRNPWPRTVSSART